MRGPEQKKKKKKKKTNFLKLGPRLLPKKNELFGFDRLSYCLSAVTRDFVINGSNTALCFPFKQNTFEYNTTGLYIKT
jgi:hypothetical protein